MAKRTGIAQELFLFLKNNKAWWMAPIFLVLLLLILLVVFAPAYLPGIYSLF
jgi:uncharacterized integral membrane protein